MNTKIFATIIWEFFFISILNAQVTQEWVARYNSSGSRIDIISAMVIDASENVYVTGYTTTESYSWDEDFVTIKYNSSGVEQWVQIFNGTMDSVDKALGIAVDQLGNVYVTGSSISNVYGDRDIVTIKYNPAGEEQWLHRTSELYHDGFPTSIVTDESGFVYVSGLTYYLNQTFTTIKLNADGAEQWIANEPYAGGWITAMKVDGSGNVYVTGKSWGDAQYDYVTIKYNFSGQRQWMVVYNGITEFSNDEPKSIAVDNSGNVYVTGSSEGSYNNNDFLTIKYDSYGAQQWTARYASPEGYGDDAYSIAVDNSGNTYVTGRSFGVDTDYDYVTLKYNSSGTQQWMQRYNGSDAYAGDDIPYEVVFDTDGNVYVTGSCKNGGGYCTIKYNSSGAQQWLLTYRGPGDNTDVAISVKVGTSGNVFVSGISTGIGTMQDFATIKYSQNVSTVKEESRLIDNYELFENYPNPFNPSTIISYQLPVTSQVSLKVYDVLGKEVAILFNEEKSAGTHKLTFEGSGLASGIYYYQLRAGSFSESKKMILIK